MYKSLLGCCDIKNGIVAKLVMIVAIQLLIVAKRGVIVAKLQKLHRE